MGKNVARLGEVSSGLSWGELAQSKSVTIGESTGTMLIVINESEGIYDESC